VAQKVEGERHPAEGATRKVQNVDMIKGLHDNDKDEDADGEIARIIDLVLLPLTDF
jgi:hypothetical protein